MEEEYIAGGLSPLSGRPGGKYYLARAIVSRTPAHDCYCEPFCGAAWIFFKKARAARECLNDLDRDIVNFFETVRTRFDELLERGRWVFHSRAIQQNFIAEPLPSWEEDAVERAFRLYYLLRTSYRGRAGYGQRPTFVSSPNSPRTFNRGFFTRQLEFAARRLEKVMLECLDWREVLRIYDSPGTFFYLDPPYPKTSFAYGRPWSWAEYGELARALASLKGHFLLSLNDLPECREIFSGFKMERIRLRGAMDVKRKFRNELLFANYDYGQGRDEKGELVKGCGQ